MVAHRIFLDTNYYFDLIKRKTEKLEHLRDEALFISPISPPIFFYSYKIKVPDERLNRLQDLFGVVPLTKHILDKSLTGPTIDLEDNIQLHSAAEAECDYFLTNDKALLNMKFFGKTRIVSNLN